MSAVLGVDLGSRRIGLAVSDRSGTLASPHSVLERAPQRPHDHEAIVSLAREVGAQKIVVGLPRSLSGDDGPAARDARAEALELQTAAGDAVTVELHDERFTTVIAERRLRATPRRGRAKREPVDAAAAAEMLQSYLDQIARVPRGR